eukprot:GHVO01038731.1.p1 GENE.GHVO01038731.1~~GHVO01038731.1.p1  ORF type:complete len:434 (+),score=28.93 GHVO01038731.1:72-1304(+)
MAGHRYPLAYRHTSPQPERASTNVIGQRRPRSHTYDVSRNTVDTATSPLELSAILHRGMSATVCLCSPHKSTEYDDVGHVPKESNDPDDDSSVSVRITEAWKRLNEAVRDESTMKLKDRCESFFLYGNRIKIKDQRSCQSCPPSVALTSRRTADPPSPSLQPIDTDKLVVKVFHKDICTENEILRARIELNILRLIGNHPAILPLHSFVETPSEMCLFFVHATHGDLHALTNNMVLPEAIVIHIVSQILDGLQYIHQLGWIHCDVKPENVLIFNNDDVCDTTLPVDWNTAQVKLCDLGLAENVKENGYATFEGVRGTTGFIAPELLKRNDFNGKIDVWAVGIVAYMLLVGYEPFYPPSSCAISGAEVELDIRYWNKISEGCQDFVKSLLQVDPLKRPTALAAHQMCLQIR